jgi:hypothetical protein
VHSRNALRLSLILCLGGAIGCGTAPPRGEVEGTVRSRGKPLANVLVTFVPDPDQKTAGLRASAQTDGAGRYRLRGEDRQPGAVVGAYRVVIEDLDVYAVPRSPDGTLLRPPPVRFAPHFGDPLKTPLRKRVESGSQVIDLDLGT